VLEVGGGGGEGHGVAMAAGVFGFTFLRRSYRTGTYVVVLDLLAVCAAQLK
jgi:hypothetical protein